MLLLWLDFQASHDDGPGSGILDDQHLTSLLIFWNWERTCQPSKVEYGMFHTSPNLVWKRSRSH